MAPRWFRHGPSIQNRPVGVNGIRVRVCGRRMRTGCAAGGSASIGMQVVLAPHPACRRGGWLGPWGGARTWSHGRRRRRPTAVRQSLRDWEAAGPWLAHSKKSMADSVSEAPFVGVPAAWAGTGGVCGCGGLFATGCAAGRAGFASSGGTPTSSVSEFVWHFSACAERRLLAAGSASVRLIVLARSGLCG